MTPEELWHHFKRNFTGTPRTITEIIANRPTHHVPPTRKDPMPTPDPRHAGTIRPAARHNATAYTTDVPDEYELLCSCGARIRVESRAIGSNLRQAFFDALADHVAAGESFDLAETASPTRDAWLTPDPIDIDLTDDPDPIEATTTEPTPEPLLVDLASAEALDAELAGISTVLRHAPKDGQAGLADAVAVILTRPNWEVSSAEMRAAARILRVVAGRIRAR